MAKNIKNPKKTEANNEYDEIIMTLCVPMRLTDLARISGDENLMKKATSVHDFDSAAAFMRETRREMKTELPAFYENSFDPAKTDEIIEEAAEKMCEIVVSLGLSAIVLDDIGFDVRSIIPVVTRFLSEVKIRVSIEGRKGSASHAFLSFGTPEAEKQIQEMIEKVYDKMLDLLKAIEESKESQPEE